MHVNIYVLKGLPPLKEFQEHVQAELKITITFAILFGYFSLGDILFPSFYDGMFDVAVICQLDT